MIPKDRLKRELDDLGSTLIAPDAALLHREVARRDRVRRNSRAAGGVCAAAVVLAVVGGLYLSADRTEQVVVVSENPVTTTTPEAVGPGESDATATGETVDREPSETYVTSAVPAGAMSEVHFLKSDNGIFHSASFEGIAQQISNECGLPLSSTSAEGYELVTAELKEFMSALSCDTGVRIRTDGSISVFATSDDVLADALARASELGLSIDTELDG